MPERVNRVALASSWVIASVLALGLVAPRTALACSCMAESVEEARARAAAIFEGRVDAIAPAEDQLAVRIHVTQAWRGVDHETIEVRTGDANDLCRFEFVVGEHYLVYASRDEASGRLFVSLCSRTRLASAADEDRQILGSGTVPIDVASPAPSAGASSAEGRPSEDEAGARPATHAGCASCSVASSSPPRGVGAIATLLLAALATRRRARR